MLGSRTPFSPVNHPVLQIHESNMEIRRKSEGTFKTHCESSLIENIDAEISGPPMMEYEANDSTDDSTSETSGNKFDNGTVFSMKGTGITISKIYNVFNC